MNETKVVSIRKAKVGDKINTIHTGNRYISADWEVVEVCGAFVKLAPFGNKEKTETYSTEDTYYEVPLTKEEFRNKYQTEAAKIYPLLLHPLDETYDWRTHTMDNSWCELSDIYEFAASLYHKDLYFVGWFKLDYPRVLFDNSELDIGIVVKDRETDEIIWCHASSDWIEDMKEDYFLRQSY